MIRINLLPVRAAKKKETLRMQLTIAGLITFFVIAVMMVAYVTLRSEASALAQEISKGNDEIAELQKKIGELSKIKEQKRVVEEKLGIIKKLEAARTGPTELLRKLSEAIPDRAWLALMKETPSGVSIQGYADTDDVVADFMRGLQKFKELGSVELDVAQRLTEKETGKELTSFSLKLEREAPREKDKEKGKAKK
ncbi:MAG: PilN domain-containing protein [Deltaproteobacteria bacterium]